MRVLIPPGLACKACLCPGTSPKYLGRKPRCLPRTLHRSVCCSALTAPAVIPLAGVAGVRSVWWLPLDGRFLFVASPAERLALRELRFTLRPGPAPDAMADLQCRVAVVNFQAV